MSDYDYMDPRKKVHRKWRRRHRLKIFVKSVAFLFIAVCLIIFGYRAYQYYQALNQYDDYPLATQGVEPTNSTISEPFKLPTAAYGEKIDLDPGISVTLEKVNVTKNGARFNVTASFSVDNLSDEDFRINPNSVELIDGRGYTYFKEADKPEDKRQVGRLLAPAKKQSDIEIAFFVDHYAIYNQFSLLVGGKRIQIKAEGDPSTKFILGETVVFNTTQW